MFHLAQALYLRIAAAAAAVRCCRDIEHPPPFKRHKWIQRFRGPLVRHQMFMLLLRSHFHRLQNRRPELCDTMLTVQKDLPAPVFPQIILTAQHQGHIGIRTVENIAGD